MSNNAERHRTGHPHRPGCGPIGLLRRIPLSRDVVIDIAAKRAVPQLAKIGIPGASEVSHTIAESAKIARDVGEIGRTIRYRNHDTPPSSPEKWETQATTSVLLTHPERVAQLFNAGELSQKDIERLQGHKWEQFLEGHARLNGRIVRVEEAIEQRLRDPRNSELQREVGNDALKRADHFLERRRERAAKRIVKHYLAQVVTNGLGIRTLIGEGIVGATGSTVIGLIEKALGITILANPHIIPLVALIAGAVTLAYLVGHNIYRWLRVSALKDQQNILARKVERQKDRIRKKYDLKEDNRGLFEQASDTLAAVMSAADALMRKPFQRSRKQ